MTIGYNVAADFVNLFQASETHTMGNSDRLSDELDDLVDQMQKIQILLSHLANDTDDSNRVDWRNSPEKIALITELQKDKDPALANLFELGVYEWKDEKLNRLIERLNGHINRVISPGMQQKMTEITQVQHESNQIIELVTTGIKDAKNLIDRIQGNIQRAK